MILAVAVELVWQASRELTFGLGAADEVDLVWEQLAGWVRLQEAYNRPRYAPC